MFLSQAKLSVEKEAAMFLRSGQILSVEEEAAMLLRSCQIISREGGGHVPEVRPKYQQRRRRPCSLGQAKKLSVEKEAAMFLRSGQILSVEEEAAMLLWSGQIISREGGGHVLSIGKIAACPQEPNPTKKPENTQKHGFFKIFPCSTSSS
jgi:hypothetical protein